METWDAIRARRNVRAYTDRSIPSHDLVRIMEAAWRTPSSMNEQPWDFVLCTERETLRLLAETWRYARHVAGSAATVALVAPIPVDQDSRDWIFYDMGQATMSMMLTAADLGIGSSHAALEDQSLARRILGLPRTASAWVSSRSATRPIARCHRSSTRTGGHWTTSSTANAGDRGSPQADRKRPSLSVACAADTTLPLRS